MNTINIKWISALATLFVIFAVSPHGSLMGQDIGPPVTIFKGRPSVKISEGGIARTPEQITRDRAINLECVISQIGDLYYWASRENVELVRIDNGFFITFVAVTGAGYVRVFKPEAKSAAALMDSTEERFDYVEHMLIGLRNVTYYGIRIRVETRNGSMQ